MLTVFVTGFSKNSTDEALAKAMAQASSYIEKDHDVNISIVSVGEKGDGFEAVLKVVVIPMTDRKEDDLVAQDVEYEHIRLKDYLRRKHDRETAHDRRIRAYLMQHHGNFVPDAQPVKMLTLSDTEALHDIFEGVFFEVSHFGHVPDIPQPDNDIPDIKQLLARKAGKKPVEPEPE